MNATAAKVDNGTWTDPAAGKITLRKYAEQMYLPALTSEATSIKATESRFRTPILPALGHKTLGQLAAEPSVIRAWAAGLRRSYPTATSGRCSPACPPPARYRVPGGRPVNTSPLFTAPGGAVQHRSSFNAVAWQPALRGTGLPCLRENGMHALRHYFASACLHNGVDIRALAAYLGHHDPGFTLRTYVHLMPSADDRMRQAVDAVFASSDGPVTAQQGVR